MPASSIYQAALNSGLLPPVIAEPTAAYFLSHPSATAQQFCFAGQLVLLSVVAFWSAALLLRWLAVSALKAVRGVLVRLWLVPKLSFSRL